MTRPTRGKRAIGRAVGAVVVVALLSGACSSGEPTPSAAGEDQPIPEGGPIRPSDADGPYRVVDVVDGDTLKVDIDGERVTVRVVGIDTPETKDPRKPVQCFGREASARAESLLADGEVWLTDDPTQDRVDRYGRRLAHVWLPDGTLFEWAMIADGYGHEYTYDTPYEHRDELQEAEREAREDERGLWAADTCAGDTTRPVG